MKVERLELLHLRMPLVRPMETPRGPVREHELLLVRAESGGVSGYGEVPATAFPGRSYETVQTAWHVIRDFMAGKLWGQEIAAPGPISDLFAYAAKMVHNQARARGVALGCGGLVQTGVGRSHDLALAALPHFTLAAEIDESARWFAEDVIEPPLVLTPQATLEVPRAAGIGYNVSERVLGRTCVRREYALS